MLCRTPAGPCRRLREAHTASRWKWEQIREWSDRGADADESIVEPQTAGRGALREILRISPFRAGTAACASFKSSHKGRVPCQ